MTAICDLEFIFGLCVLKVILSNNSSLCKVGIVRILSDVPFSREGEIYQSKQSKGLHCSMLQETRSGGFGFGLFLISSFAFVLQTIDHRRITPAEKLS